MSTAIYPMSAIALPVGIPGNVKLLADHPGKDAIIALVPTFSADRENFAPEDLAPVGVAARVIDRQPLPHGGIHATLLGLRRVAIGEYVSLRPYMVARVTEPVEEEDRAAETVLLQEIMGLLADLVRRESRYGPELLHIMRSNEDEPGMFADFLASHLQMNLDLRKKLMSILGAMQRLLLLRQFIQDELMKLMLMEEMETKARSNLKELRRRNLLMEQMQAIKKELGEEEPQERFAGRIRASMEGRALPPEVKSILDWELERLKLLPISSQDFGNACIYIEWLMSIPWMRDQARPIDLDRVERMLSRDYHSIMNVKTRILEALSPLALDPELSPPVLCIVGPPATGKTSIARSLATALEKKFSHFSISGCKDDGDIKGVMRGLVGESPGLVARALRSAGTQNLLVVIEDIDEMSDTPLKGNPVDALLDLFDPARRSTFLDRYLNTPLDLSSVFFVTTARILWDIPDQISAMVKIVTLSGYTEKEKLQISRHFIIPKELARAGLDRKMVRFEPSAIKKIIREYTDEGGLRQLAGSIELAATKCAYERATRRRRKWRIDSREIARLIGPPRYPARKTPRGNRIGVANGLAWTSAGGDLLTIEALRMPGTGELIVTGQLGEVMQESVRAAYSYIKSKAREFDIDTSSFREYDIHIHFPAGAIPKDGPSAGVSIAAAIASALAKIPVRSDVAMTGEVTLSGNVMGVGGLTEKLMAAYRSGIHTVVLPAENAADLEDVPDEIKRGMQLILVKQIDEVLRNALVTGAKRRRRPRTSLRTE
jgi:ATP-dependent Lon protease